MPGEDNLRKALSLTVKVFRESRVAYALVGAWALAVWGRVRATQDLDFLVLVDGPGLERLAARMVRSGMAIDEGWLEINPMLRGSQLRLRSDGISVDLMRPRDAQDEQALRRRRKRRLEGRYYWFPAPEDLILQKIKAGRPRDFEDVVSVVERCRRELDRPYLRRWTARLRLSRELDYVLGLG